MLVGIILLFHFNVFDDITAFSGEIVADRPDRSLLFSAPDSLGSRSRRSNQDAGLGGVTVL